MNSLHQYEFKFEEIREQYQSREKSSLTECLRDQSKKNHEKIASYIEGNCDFTEKLDKKFLTLYDSQDESTKTQIRLSLEAWFDKELQAL